MKLTNDTKEIELTKSITCKIKGIAILLMIIHHSFGFPNFYIHEVNYKIINILGIPSYLWIANSTKICVSIFAFLTGYTYFINKDNHDIKYSLKKIFALLKRYWIILFVVFIPLFFICGPFPKMTPKQFILNMFGIKNDINLFCWYVYFYIATLLLLPSVKKLEQNGKFWSFIIFPCFIFMLTMIGIYTKKINYIIYNIFYFFPCVWYGFLTAKYKLISKILKVINIKQIWQAIFIIIFVLISRVLTVRKFTFNFDIIYVPIIIAMLTFIFNKEIKLESTISLLGKHSANLWFLHSIFFSPIIKEKTQMLVYFVHNPILVIFLIIVLCLPLSILTNFIIKKTEFKEKRTAFYTLFSRLFGFLIRKKESQHQ